MPLVLSRNASSRAEDSHIVRLRNQALRNRSHRFVFSPSEAQEIEKKQKLAYERSTKKPALPKPSPSNGYSDPEWEPARGCWLVYNRSNSSEWKAWEAMSEEWVDIKKFDDSSSNPSSPDDPDVNGSGSGSGKTKKKTSSTGDLETTAEREARPISRSQSEPTPETTEKSKYTFKSVAQNAWRVLAWKKRANEKD